MVDNRIKIFQHQCSSNFTYLFGILVLRSVIDMKKKQSHFRKVILLLTLVVGLIATMQFSSIKSNKFRDQTSNENQTQNSDQLQHQPIQLPVEVEELPITEIPERELTFQDHLAPWREDRQSVDLRYLK